jgi:uncharacterized protein (TIGR02271 family)
MAKTVVGLFDTHAGAERAVEELHRQGFTEDEVGLVANNATGIYNTDRSSSVNQDEAAEGAGSGAIGGTVVGGGLGLLLSLGLLVIPGIGPVAAAGTLATVLGSTALGAGIGAAAGGLIGALVNSGVPENEANLYAEGVRRGGTLVMVTTSDARADDAVAILEASDPVNVEEREAGLRQSGWQGFDPEGRPYEADEIERYRHEAAHTPQTSERGHNQGATVMPVVEEELQVGKRQVERGKVRVRTHVVERPVEEQVHLRDEKINVERRPANRDLTAADQGAFQERNFELSETHEEAVVDKRARVVEEVVVDKTVDDRTKTIRDTVRHTDVDVDQTGGQHSRNTGKYAAYENDFRNHYQQTFANSGYSYEEYSPVYRYGHDLAMDTQYRERDWADVEPDARRRWEDRNPGTWEQFKDSIRYAWDKARGRR